MSSPNSKRKTTAPPVYRPCPTPLVLQAKTALPLRPHAATSRMAQPGPGAPPVYRPQLKTAAVQPKVPSNIQRPTAPPVYRPEPKKFIQPRMAVTTRTPPLKAPLVYRPQPAPKVLQAKVAIKQPAPFAQAKQHMPALQLLHRQAVIQRQLKVRSKTDGGTFNTKNQLRNWGKRKTIWNTINQDNPNPSAIMAVLYKWAADGTHTFDTWPEAIAAAKLQIRAKDKKRKRHFEEPMSPLRDDEKKLFKKVKRDVDDFYDANEGKEELKRLVTETQLQGMIGEHSHHITLDNLGLGFEDANSIAKNIPGIDTLISGHDMIFGQSKMHLCSNDTNIYLNHVKKRNTYAKTLTKRLISDTKGAEVIRTGIYNFAEDTGNEELKDIMDQAYEEVGKGTNVEDLVGYGGEEGLVDRIGNQMCFPIPSDLFPKLPTNQQSNFTQLDFSTRSLLKIKGKFDYRPVQERIKKTEEDLDPTYTG